MAKNIFPVFEEDNQRRNRNISDHWAIWAKEKVKFDPNLLKNLIIKSWSQK
ncbi:MAG: hypothetical protein AB4063_16945 [Crocosphaera sp.]